MSDWSADWETCSIAELGTVVGGSTPSRGSAHFWGGPHPWLTPGELTSLETKHVHATRENITPAGLASCGAKLLPRNALLVTSRATIGSVALSGVELATNQGFKSIILSGSASPDFYYHLCKTLSGALIQRASGTTFLEISTREFSAIRVPRPPLAEQQKIAEILDTVDEAIRKTEQIIAKLKQVKQGLLHDLLTRGIDDNGELRDPERHPEQFKDSPLGRIPKAWEVRSLGSCMAVRGGKRLPAGHAYAAGRTGFRYLRVLDFFKHEFAVSELASLEYSTFEALSRYEIQSGELFISIAGSIGYAGLFKGGGDERVILTENAARLVPLVEFVPEFAVIQINGDAVQRQIGLETGVGAGVPKLALFRIEQLLMVWPPSEEQRRIVERLDAIERRFAAEVRALSKLHAIKQGLMEDLLTGKVRVTNLLESSP